jgi:formylmethanofuran dehydrogenase subunit E
MESFEDLLQQAEVAHGHMCAGQILGVRMALLACRRLGVEDPRGADRKKLVSFVEIDRSATDAIGMVTGCRLGKRALKFRDWGKMAATFVNVSTGLALRIVALENSRELARQRFPHIESKGQQQMMAYRELSDKELFRERWVAVDLPPSEMPGYKGERVTCDECGEGVNFDRFVELPAKAGFETVSGTVGSPRRLCMSCADPGLRYWRPVEDGRGQDLEDKS